MIYILLFKLGAKTAVIYRATSSTLLYSKKQTFIKLTILRIIDMNLLTL